MLWLAGVGKALATEFLKAGDSVVICSRSGVPCLKICSLFYFLPYWPPTVSAARPCGLTSVCVAGDNVQSVVRELDQLAKSNEGSIQVSLPI